MNSSPIFVLLEKLKAPVQDVFEYNWETIGEALGVLPPGDYRVFMERLGPGEFAETWTIFGPSELAPWHRKLMDTYNWCAKNLILADETPDLGIRVLFPFAASFSSSYLCWLWVPGAPVPEGTVYYQVHDGELVAIGPSFSECLFDIGRGAKFPGEYLGELRGERFTFEPTVSDNPPASAG